jgi:hypothetical protein
MLNMKSLEIKLSNGEIDEDEYRKLADKAIEEFANNFPINLQDKIKALFQILENNIQEGGFGLNEDEGEDWDNVDSGDLDEQ